MGILKYGLIVLVLIVVGIQFYPVERSNPSIVQDFEGPEAVELILRESCYDCHSNETVWPWYSDVAPVSWLVAHDVEEGRHELNFSNWEEHAGDAHILEEIIEEVEEGKMPMKIYVFGHSGAKITSEELGILKAWVKAD